jgi:hypothetical protein
MIPDARGANMIRPARRSEPGRPIHRQPAVDLAAILATLSDDVRIRVAVPARELTVFFRPLAAMQLVAEVIGGQMARGSARRPRACAELGGWLFGSVCGSFTPVHDGSPATADRLSVLARNAGGLS